MSSPTLVLEARNIVKRYPGQVALNDVTFRAYAGCINVLIGENGAGKSTLMRILSGVEAPDGGEIFLNGSQVQIASPRDAAQHGIAIVHQELAVLANLDVSENIFLGREMTSIGFLVDRSGEDRRSVSALAQMRKPIEVNTQASGLSLGSRQVLEIARAVTHRSKILILDEPTSALSQEESEALFATIAELLKAGLTIIYISHRLEELMRLGDYFTVLRSGQVVGESVRGEVTRDWIVSTMSGRAAQDRAVSKRQQSDEIVLDVQDLSLASGAEDGSVQTALHGISFQVRKGEILGIYGLLGAGRTELLEVLAGLRVSSTGRVKLRGSMLRLGSVGQALEAGIVLVPEDRQRDGLIPELSVRENVVLAMAGEHWVSRARETAIVRELVRKLRMGVRDLELPVTALSGGNQQKVLLARCLVRSPLVLLLDEPTRGVDANAKVEIYHLLRELAGEGLSIVFTSSEIEETEELADRALVFCQGRISAELAGEAMTDSALMNAASPRTQLEQEALLGVATV